MMIRCYAAMRGDILIIQRVDIYVTMIRRYAARVHAQYSRSLFIRAMLSVMLRADAAFMPSHDVIVY